MVSQRDTSSGHGGGPGSATSAAALETWLGRQDGGAPAPSAAPALTILYHPQMERVGDRLFLAELLSGEGVLLSRTAPDFVSRARGARVPLSDRNISRSPVSLTAAPGGGVRLALGDCRTRVAVRGEPLQGAVDLSAADVERGVVVELAGRVVLLLHHATTARATGMFNTLVDDPIGADLLGDSEGMRRLRQDVRRVADLDVPVLIRGETGTGKELVARALHRASARREAPFVAVNLGAVSPQLAVAELFGAERGAFTGADRRRQGYFHQAHGGTLFLDEVGEAPPELQVALLRALETGEILAVGGQQAQKVDVRVIAATDANLEQKITDGDFRAPLLHRLAAYEIWIPPLRERRDDIGPLLLSFLKEALAQIHEPHRLTSPPATGELWLPASHVARLVDFDWPGNIRQLRNVVRQIIIGSRGRSQAVLGSAVERQLQGHAPARISAVPVVPIAPLALPAPAPVALEEGRSSAPSEPPPSPREDRRRPADIGEDELAEALRASRWDFAAAAALLHTSRTSIYALVEGSSRFRTAGDLKPEELERAFHECGGDVERLVDRFEVSERALRRRLRELDLDERGGAGATKPRRG